jgi:hypothetical protein
MKRSLLVGIDRYANFRDLHGCGNDARALLPLLARNEDDSPNFDCRVASSAAGLARDELLGLLDDLCADGPDCALFYFAGHGTPVNRDVALVTSDGTTVTPGVRFGEVLERMNATSIHEIVVILDCCFSGGASTISALGTGSAYLREGLSILTASRDDQVSLETANGRGEFSCHLEAALQAGAADILGHINVSNVYAYVSELFGAWDQRPTFKANVDRLHDLRRCNPRVALPVLRSLPTWFPSADHYFALDPSYEPDALPHDLEHEAVFAGLQQLRSSRLLEPVGERHLYYAAIHSTGCRLTPLGRHYWQLAAGGRI